MYEEHPSFKSIPDDAKIWRFMDFAKFCAMLEKGTLFFSMPGNFTDPWEGYLPSKHYDEATYLEAGIPPEFIETLIDVSKNKTPRMLREEFAVNCWHVSDHESEAFWKNYSDRGIAIQSTFGKLKQSFDIEKDYTVFIGTVEYKDPKTDFVEGGNLFNSLLWKRKSFDHEKELRAVIWGAMNREGEGLKPFSHANGQEIKVNIPVMVENIYTNPFEKENWFNDLTKDIVTRYGLSVPVTKSDLMDSPF